jgi:hypothetical protein
MTSSTCGFGDSIPGMTHARTGAIVTKCATWRMRQNAPLVNVSEDGKRYEKPKD